LKAQGSHSGPRLRKVALGRDGRPSKDRPRVIVHRPLEVGLGLDDGLRLGQALAESTSGST